MSWSVPRWRLVGGLEQGFGDRVAPAPRAVATLRQVHGRCIHHLDDAPEDGEGDGLVTDRPATLVGVWTADCVPVHLIVPGSRIAAALHCGWRGGAAGMIPAALELLERRWNVRPREIEAALGPAIDDCCYEVGEEVRSAFMARAGSELGGVGFRTRGHRLYMDLRAFLAAEFESFGVAYVARFGPCTGCRTDLLYSHRKEGKTGRQLNWIGWAA
ncbi:MAG TPA: polyphenol oxidase family protein [Candidatus Binatia bacterium]|nr:polyphenol oxidase family protein [Candidatus Binatia bacterium]